MPVSWSLHYQRVLAYRVIKSDKYSMAKSVVTQTAGCNSPYDLLMNLAMDVASCFVWYVELKNGTNGHHLAVFSVDIAFACHFVAPPPTFTPIGVLMVLAMPVKNYLK